MGSEEVDAGNGGNTAANPANQRSIGFFEKFITFAFVGVIVVSTLWNWDGFWQTKIRPLNDVLHGAFTSKWTEEQVKLANIQYNSDIVQRMEERLQAMTADRDMLSDEVSSLKANTGAKCEFLDSAIRMFDIATRDLSAEAKQQKIACTNTKCIQLMNEREAIQSICPEIRI